ncbi:MAG: metal-dependent phosphohydrolase sub domain protein [Firmicutes bacterium]|nr:metal-dependent phosphohydrolase sub domain protein [Bacillota bacterium]
MISDDIYPLKRWFREYVRSFYSEDPDIQAHVRLKEDHTARVCERMTELAESLRLEPERSILAQTVALFHDVGRFQQYTQYRTFNDFRSEDHACMGVRILKETGVLGKLPEVQQVLVQKAVRYHNGREIPPDSEESVYLSRMIRDADKIDILEMITNEDALFQMLPMPEYGELEKVSAGTLNCILQGAVARFEHIRTSADLMLFRMSWMFDMNFPWTFRKVQERNYLEKMAEKLPESPEVQRAVDSLKQYRDQRAVE